MHAVALAALLSFCAAAPPAHLGRGVIPWQLPQNRTDQCTDFGGCEDTCWTQTNTYCSSQCTGTAAQVKSCEDKCLAQLDACDEWCTFNCPQ